MVRFIICIVLSVGVSVMGSAEEGGHYDYGGASPEALEAYHQGWHEILVNGRWSEAEKLFRKSVELDPDFIMGKALVGRISGDVQERRTILTDIRANLDRVDADGRLILDIFLMNIEAAIARADGRSMPEGFPEKRAKLALKNFKTFSDKYPADHGILIEYFEWQHAVEGANAALRALNGYQKENGSPTPFMTFFAGSLYAELGQHDRALLSANVFEKVISNPDFPQPYYLYAQVYRASGRLHEAKKVIDKAVALGPQHLIAVGLQAQIDATLNGR